MQASSPLLRSDFAQSTVGHSSPNGDLTDSFVPATEARPPAGSTEETSMATRHKVTVSREATAPRLSAAERRAERVAALATQQSDLKREAAERRAKRELADRASTSN
jgi:hypothetical protein